MAQGTQRPAKKSPEPAAPPARKRKGSAGTVIGALIVVGVVIYGFTQILPGPEQHPLPPEEKFDPKKNKPPEKPVTLAERPKRLWREAVKAIMAKDRAAMLKLCNIPGNPFEEILTDERAEQITLSYQATRYKITEEKIEGPKARFAVLFENARGLEVEELLFEMEQQGSDVEAWKIMKISNRWGPGSSHPQEGGFSPIGPNRVSVPYVKKPDPVKQKYVEAEPTTLDFVPGTSDAMKADIEARIKLLKDKEHPAVGSAAVQALLEIGKPAIPSLLNTLAKLDTRHEDDDMLANLIDQLLGRMTGRDMGYPGGGRMSEIPPMAARIRAVRRWFGWWQDHKDQPLAPRTTVPDDK